MSRKYLVFLLLFANLYTNGQARSVKYALKIEDFENWSSVSDGHISNNGKYVYYFKQLGESGEKELNILGIDNKWKKVFSANDQDALRQVAITDDSKYLLGISPQNILRIIKLGTDKTEEIKNVSSFSLFKHDKTEWLSYSVKDGKALYLRNLTTGKTITYSEVDQYTVSPNKDHLILFYKNGDEHNELVRLSLAEVGKEKQQILWNGFLKGDIHFTLEGQKIAFLGELQIDHKKSARCWTYEFGNSNASAINNLSFENKDLLIDGIQRFTRDGDGLILNLRMVLSNEVVKRKFGGVDVYNYQDEIILSAQKNNPIRKKANEDRLVGVLYLKGDKLIKLAGEGESLTLPGENQLSEEWVFKHNNKCGSSSCHSMASMKTGVQIPLPYKPINFSMDGSYVLLQQDKLEKQQAIYSSNNVLYSYEIATGILRDLTSDLPIDIHDKRPEEPFDIEESGKLNFEAFIEGTNDVIVRDDYDLWRVDITASTKPVNITSGYGRRNRVVFGLNSTVLKGINSDVVTILDQHRPIILTSFNYLTKDNDYYRIELDKLTKEPVRVTLGGYMHEGVFPMILSSVSPLLRARDADIYLLCRMNAASSPNYYWTKDFKKLVPVSNNYPERNYNWLSSELVQFKGLDGSPRQGILYKPENFDPSKKYPVIFYYYTQFSNELNEYKRPELSGAVINIPYYVSNGYLVFQPDVQLVHGKGYRAAYNDVMGAANYISAQPFVDSTKMAIHGHSHGGGETNYLVTHTNRFAAAVSGSGSTDNIGYFGMPTHGSKLYEGDVRFRMGYGIAGTPFDNLKDYIEFSAKLFADKMETPLLIMHNKNDYAVLFSQGLSFFNTLWNLGKQAWMLQYDGEGHVIDGKEAQLDFTIRMKQFFDHYLMNAAAPKWMTRGIPESMKGIDDGLELDLEIKTPGKINARNLPYTQGY